MKGQLSDAAREALSAMDAPAKVSPRNWDIFRRRLLGGMTYRALGAEVHLNPSYVCYIVNWTGTRAMRERPDLDLRPYFEGIVGWSHHRPRA